MTKLIITSVLAFACLMLAPNAFGQSCAPAGAYPGGGPPSFDYIANGLPAGPDCWGLDRATFVTGTTDCGWTSNAFDFDYAGSMGQSFTVPANDHRTHYALSYLLDFEDPHHDAAWNNIWIYVFDATTNTQLASDYYNGAMPDLFCMQRSITYTGDLAGHNIGVHFGGSKGYSDTHVRVRFVSFWGST